MERHFTATVYVFHENKVLLHYHAKLSKWLPPGGHIEPNETPPEAARREVKEETGLEIAFIEQENLKIDAYNATSFERPFLCLLEHIPERPEKPAHQHMDLIYVARPLEIASLEDVSGFRWFTYEETKEIENDLFPDTREMIKLLLKEITIFDGVFQP
ncbi:MAG: NUDIX domain-containing protein [Chlamydiota bacterium]